MGNEIIDSEMLGTRFKTEKDFKKINFPLTFEFKITTLSNDFVARDVNGNILAYVRQKMFKFKEEIQIFNDESKSSVLYTIRADKWIDFNTNYTFFDKDNQRMGSVARRGMRSLWKAHYQIHNAEKEMVYQIGELNPWTKVFDALFGEIPILGMFTGYVFNPKYSVEKEEGKTLVQMKKDPSFFGKNFTITKEDEFPDQDAEEVMLSLMMFVLLERRRG